MATNMHVHAERVCRTRKCAQVSCPAEPSESRLNCNLDLAVVAPGAVRVVSEG